MLPNYEILGKLGEGGMGIVYEAEQKEPSRRVALKVVRGEQHVDETFERLIRREADTLARLDHPGIGRIYESGRTEDGRHFFAMELVRGEPLDEWFAKHPMQTREDFDNRIRLLRKIGEAVHYAHQRGVIHRDLKPANVMVTAADSQDRVPQIKVLDFGLARITDSDVAATQVTEIGVIKGTLNYMSPEQATGDPNAIDLRSDVYALGVMLYEALTHQRPYEVRGSGLIELVRVIHEQPPTPLAEVWNAPRKLDRDIETITLKALAKDPDLRYDSAAALANDLSRFVARQPILARPPSTLYLLRKLVLRNRLPAALLATLIVLAIGSAVVMSVLLARSVASEANATREAETARRVLNFMTDMFEVADPSQARGETVAAVEVLDQGARRIERELTDEPLIRASLMETMGRVYSGLGLYDRAESLLDRAIDARQDAASDEATLLRTRTAIADVYRAQSRFDVSESVLRETLEKQRETLGEDHPDTLTSRLSLVAALERLSSFDEAEAMVRNVLARSATASGDTSELQLAARSRLGVILHAQGRYEEAAQELSAVLDSRRTTLGEDHPKTLGSLSRLALLHSDAGRFEEAHALYERSIQAMARTLGSEHRETLSARGNLAVLLFDEQRYEEADALLTDLLATQERALPEAHYDTLITLSTLGAVKQNLGQQQEAADYLLRALDGFTPHSWQSAPGDSHCAQQSRHASSSAGRSGQRRAPHSRGVRRLLAALWERSSLDRSRARELGQCVL